MAVLSMWSGFALTKAGRLLRSGLMTVSPERGWRAMSAGDIVVRVPPEWGDPEDDPAGGFVIHNRPRRFRIDGDAIWYASAIELRFRPAGVPLSRSAEGMTLARKTIGTGAPLVVELAIANGVGPEQRRIAWRVFASVKARQREDLRD
jgi:hypothetical protein